MLEAINSVVTAINGVVWGWPMIILTNTGVNTSKLNRLEHFIREFEIDGKEYQWLSMPELETDKDVQKKNYDIVRFVKELV